MDSTGAVERVGTDERSPWWWEHRARYRFVSGWVSGLRVLDIACGTGVGLDLMLAAEPRSIVGIDLSVESLTRARERATSDVYLCAADARRVPLRDRSVDVVVSFETLEHVDPADDFLSELARVVVPDGLVVISTPNALNTRPVAGIPRNPFHVQEFEPSELAEMLGRHFSQVELLGQSVGTDYGMSPYWALPEHLPKGVLNRMKVWSWKAQNRLLPHPVKDWLSLVLLKRHFNPVDEDFVFTEDLSARAHVTVALCRP